MSAIIRSLVLAACALLMLNLVGTDPADIIFAGAVALILLSSPGSVLLDSITLPTRVVLAMIIGLYAISCSFGWRSPSFILYFVSGLMFSISLCWAVSISDRLQIGLAMFGGTLGLNLASILLWANNYWTDGFFFDLFRDGRFMGPSGDPNMTGLSGAFSLYYFADRALRPNASAAVLFASIMGVIVGAAIILTSGSRAAWGASLVGLAVLLFLSRKLIGGQAVVVGTVAALAMAVLSSGVLSSSADVEDFSERFQTLFVQDRSAEQERFEFVYTRAALDVAADHPLGIGPGMTPFYTGISSVDGDPIGAHNSYVEIATENGWPMAALLFGLLLVAARRIHVLAEADVFLNDISCRTIFAGLSATAVFGFGHDLLRLAGRMDFSDSRNLGCIQYKIPCSDVFEGGRPLMMADYIVTALQLITSLARLVAFAFAVVTIGKVADNTGIILAIGYLPYLAFFDILIQSTSRALHLRDTLKLPVGIQFCRIYAMIAISVIGVLFALSLWYESARILFVMISWLLGALGYLWERLIAQRKSQALLAGIEIFIIAAGIGLFALVTQFWPVLLLCIVGFPVARLVTLALSFDRAGSAFAQDDRQDGSVAAPQTRLQMAGYVGSSLAQQFAGATAAALPSIYGQFTGDVSHLAVNVAIFRTLHSLAAVVSMSINAMSTRIFYRQTGDHFEAFEVRFLEFSSLVAVTIVILVVLAMLYSLVDGRLPVIFAAIVFPAMALVNAESSLLYNRGLPFGTFHCQIMILALSASMLFALIGSKSGVMISVTAFVLYMILTMPATIRRHRRILQMSDAA